MVLVLIFQIFDRIRFFKFLQLVVKLGFYICTTFQDGVITLTGLLNIYEIIGVLNGGREQQQPALPPPPKKKILSRQSQSSIIFKKVGQFRSFEIENVPNDPLKNVGSYTQVWD